MDEKITINGTDYIRADLARKTAAAAAATARIFA